MCFSKEQLDGYVEDTIDEELRIAIEEHLATCKACSDVVKERTIFKKFLTQKLEEAETPHPDFEDIESFYYNKLEKKRAKEVLDHLSYCGDCSETLNSIRTGQMIEEGKIPSYVEFPEKLPPKLEAYLRKNKIKETVLAIIQKKFPDNHEVFKNLWHDIWTLSEMNLPKKVYLAGVLKTLEDLKPETAKFQIFKIIETLEDASEGIDEEDDTKTIIEKIRSTAKKNKLKHELLDDLIESAKLHF